MGYKLNVSGNVLIIRNTILRISRPPHTPFPICNKKNLQIPILLKGFDKSLTPIPPKSVTYYMDIPIYCICIIHGKSPIIPTILSNPELAQYPTKKDTIFLNIIQNPLHISQHKKKYKIKISYIFCGKVFHYIVCIDLKIINYIINISLTVKCFRHFFSVPFFSCLHFKWKKNFLFAFSILILLLNLSAFLGFFLRNRMYFRKISCMQIIWMGIFWNGNWSSFPQILHFFSVSV